MAISFACDQCGKSYEVDGSLAGRRVKCKACGASLTIPGAAAAAPRPAGGAQRPPAAKRPAAPVRAAEPDVDDPYGLGDAAPDRGPAAEDVLLPRAGAGRGKAGAASASGGVPAWVWVAGGAVGLVIVVAVLAVALTRRPGLTPAPPRGGGGAGGEAFAPVVPDSTEATAAAAAGTAAPAAPSPGFQRDDASAAGSQTVWRVKADPPASPVEFPPVPKLMIPVPEAFNQRDSILYPTTPSPFLMVGGNDADDHYREVWDLRTVKRVGRLAGRIETARPMALSPDGAYFVTHTNPVPRTTDIWRVADAKRIGRIEDKQNMPDFLDFAGPGEGRIVLGTSYAKAFEVWDFLQGKRLLTFQTPDGFDRDSVALSPGRRYMALMLAQKDRLQVYDLTTGGLAGETLAPKDGTSSPDCEGMAFSPDGTALTGLFVTGGRTTHLMTWDATTGTLENDFETPGTNPYGKTFSYEDEPVQWLPDQSGWLIRDQTIVERKSGQPVWPLPFDKKRGDEEGPRKILDADRMIALAKVRDRKTFRLVPLQKDKIQAALGMARGGGNAADVALPPLTTADVAGAKKVAPAAGPVAWAAPPAAKAPAAAPAGKPITLKVTGLDVLAVVVSSPETGQALVVSSPGARLEANKVKPSQQTRQVDRYDLATGRPLNRFEIPGISTPVAFNPAATQVLMTHAGAADRLDVFAVADGKHVAGWRPYDKASGDDRNVLWSAFLDDKRVLTANKAGTLILWSLPDCKAVYVADQAAQGAPVLSPARNVLAVLRGGTLRLIDPATGAALGDGVTSGHQAEAGLAVAAIDPEGRELAALIDGTLVRWDLKTGQVAGEMPSPAPKAGWLQYGAARHVLLDNKVLVDLDGKRTVWFYEGGVHERGAGAAHRYAAGPIGSPAVLKTIDVPDKAAVRAEAAAADPKVKALLRDGASVSLQVVGNPPRDPEGFRAALIERLTERLSAVGVSVAGNQPARVVASFKETDTGKTYQLQKLGGKPQANETRTIPIRLLEWELSVADAQGAPVVIARDTTTGMGIGFIEHIPPGEGDWDGYLRNRMWLNAATKVVGHDAPYFVGRKADGPVVLPGWTFLGEPGI